MCFLYPWEDDPVSQLNFSCCLTAVTIAFRCGRKAVRACIIHDYPRHAFTTLEVCCRVFFVFFGADSGIKDIEAKRVCLVRFLKRYIRIYVCLVGAKKKPLKFI